LFALADHQSAAVRRHGVFVVTLLKVYAANVIPSGADIDMVGTEKSYAKLNRSVEGIQCRLAVALGHDVMQDANAVHASRHLERLAAKLGPGKVERCHVCFERVGMVATNVLDLADPKQDRQRQGLVTDGPLFQ
jgi:hypothetical protein